ncbi:MAG TPA: hypothetical protein VN426_12485 [Syntrophomonadaceae bacterium]|nr:hypothetical protein [Syntrophomonadaceae bacterium]
MGKKLPFLIVSLILINMCGYLGFAKSDASSIFFNFGQRLMQNKQDLNADKIILKVNHVPITKQEYDSVKDRMKFSNNAVTDDEVEDNIIKFTVQYQEAQRQGVEATEAEAKKYADEMKQLANNALKDPENAPDNSHLMLEYINGTGKTVDQFFADSITIKGYQKMLSVGNLQKKLYDEVDSTLSKDINPVEKQRLREKAFDELTEKCVTAAAVEHASN